MQIFFVHGGDPSPFGRVGGHFQRKIPHNARKRYGIDGSSAALPHDTDAAALAVVTDRDLHPLARGGNGEVLHHRHLIPFRARAGKDGGGAFSPNAAVGNPIAVALLLADQFLQHGGIAARRERISPAGNALNAFFTHFQDLPFRRSVFYL